MPPEGMREAATQEGGSWKNKLPGLTLLLPGLPSGQMQPQSWSRGVGLQAMSRVRKVKHDSGRANMARPDGSTVLGGGTQAVQLLATGVFHEEPRDGHVCMGRMGAPQVGKEDSPLSINAYTPPCCSVN